MNLRPKNFIYTGLMTTIIVLVNSVFQVINITVNDGPEPLGFLFFIAGFVSIVFFIVYVFDLFNKDYQIVHAKMISKHKNIIYVLRDDGKVKPIRIMFPEIINTLVPGQQLEITLSSILSIPYHLVAVDHCNDEHLKNQFIKSYNHIAWASRLVMEALKKSELPLEKPLSLLSHVLAAEKVWLTRINGEDSSALSIWPTHTLEQCEAIAEQNNKSYEMLFAKLGEAEFENEVFYSDSRGNPFTTKIRDILTQVSLHGSYHRGQIALLLRQAGEEATSTDYITYERQAASNKK